MSKQPKNRTPDFVQRRPGAVTNADVGAAWLSLIMLFIIATLFG